jgi:predicted GNAT family acetyltransferase
MSIEVRQDEAQGKFYAEVDGEEAMIEYEKRGDGVYDLVHTFVPPHQRGKGVAEELARQTLDRIRGEGAHIIPSCPYVHAFVERHREYQDLVSRG